MSRVALGYDRLIFAVCQHCSMSSLALAHLQEQLHIDFVGWRVRAGGAEKDTWQTENVGDDGRA